MMTERGRTSWWPKLHVLMTLFLVADRYRDYLCLDGYLNHILFHDLPSIVSEPSSPSMAPALLTHINDPILKTAPDIIAPQTSQTTVQWMIQNCKNEGYIDYLIGLGIFSGDLLDDMRCDFSQALDQTTWSPRSKNQH